LKTEEHLNAKRELNSVYWREIIPWIYYTLAERSSMDASAMCFKQFEWVSSSNFKHKKLFTFK